MNFRTTLSLLAACALLAAGCSRPAPQPPGGKDGPRPPQPVEVTSVERRDIARRIRVVGSLAPNESAAIKAEQEGLVQEIAFGEGARVSKGDLLVRIDDRELSAELERAKADLELAAQTLDRGRRAIGSGAIPKTEFDKMQSDVNRLEAEVRLYSVRLGQTRLVAPFDGVAGARLVSPGDYVDKEKTVTRIDDLSALKVEFQVPEREIAFLKPGARFTVEVARAEGEAEIAGEVYFVSPIIDRATRAAEVKGVVKDPPEMLRPGMFVSVGLELERREGVLVVPEGAVAVEVRGNAVVALTDAEPPAAEFLPVRTGLRSGGFVEIEPVAPGLGEGRRIVAAGVGGLILFPGAPLDPRPWNPPGATAAQP